MVQGYSELLGRETCDALLTSRELGPLDESQAAFFAPYTFVPLAFLIAKIA
jgi:hypothetical protein